MEDRDLFKKTMVANGLKPKPSSIGNMTEECAEIANEIDGFLLIMRPTFMLEGVDGIY